MGCTLRRLTSKCACLHALESIPELLAPHQLGFGVPGGVEAAVHASHVFLEHLPPDKAMAKVDFQNAFNSIRRDKMLRAVEDHIPALLPYVHSAYCSPSILMWNDAQLSSAEGLLCTIVCTRQCACVPIIIIIITNCYMFFFFPYYYTLCNMFSIGVNRPDLGGTCPALPADVPPSRSHSSMSRFWSVLA